MTGRDLKNKLLTTGRSQKEIADLLGIKPQSLNTIYCSQDIKTGTLERLCVVLGVNMSFFYPNNDLTSVNVGHQHGTNVNAGGTQTVTGVSIETLNEMIKANAEKDKQINLLLQKLAEK